MSVRVLIVEDHDMARMGLSVILGSNSNIEIVGMSADGQEGVDMALDLIPDVVIMDIGLPTIDGIEATARIKATNSRIKVLMYTSREADDDVFDSFKAGADGYITKGATSEQTISAVLAVSEGAGWLDPAIAKVVLTNIRHVHSILQKLYVNSRSKAISMAMKEGLV